MKTFNIKKIVISVVIALAVLVVGASSLHAVPAGHTGVVTRFGAVDDTVLSEGLHVVLSLIHI